MTFLGKKINEYIGFCSEREGESTEQSELLRTLLQPTKHTFLNRGSASVWASAPPSDVMEQARWLQSGRERERERAAVDWLYCVTELLPQRRFQWTNWLGREGCSGSLGNNWSWKGPLSGEQSRVRHLFKMRLSLVCSSCWHSFFPLSQVLIIS